MNVLDLTSTRPLDVRRPLNAYGARLQRIIDLAAQIERELVTGEELNEFVVVGRKWVGLQPVLTFRQQPSGVA